MLFLIALDNTISAQSAASYLGVSQRMVEKYITKLKNEGVLKREGGDFGGKWKVIGLVDGGNPLNQPTNNLAAIPLWPSTFVCVLGFSFVSWVELPKDLS